ncbi:MAG: ParB/RepB/Spo0J family partition protein [Candidatus Cloacimonetes bacterium]|nr:ParB/RepB/Spo0J family partition protein [Candidatus Cloacimonadota bacterium]
MINDRLGKGLGALIRDSEEAPVSRSGISTLPLDKIYPNRYQPRKIFDPDKLNELAASIRENGIIQPLIVSKTDESDYELIAGERRLEAAKLAGLTEVPVVIRSVSDKEKLQLAITENIQREDLNPLEEALAYKALIDEFSMTHAQIAQIMGKDRATITNSIRLLKLPIPIQNMINQELISPGHARVILGLEDKLQLPFAEFILKYRLSVRQAEEKAKHYELSSKSSSKPPLVSPMKEYEERLGSLLNTKASIKDKGGKGKIVLEYKDSTELIRLLDKLCGE